MLKTIAHTLAFLCLSLSINTAYAGALEFLDKANKLMEEKEKLTKTVNDTVNGRNSSQETDNSVEGIEDPSLIDKYPRSQLIAHNQNDLTRTVLPLSANLPSDRTSFRKLKLSGEQAVYVYTVPEAVSKSYLKVFTTLKNHALDANFEILWQCDSAEKNCGEYLAKQAVYEERGEDASDIYRKLTDLYNLDDDTDFAMLTARTKVKGQTYFLFMLVNKYSSAKPVTYSFELVQADDPLKNTPKQTAEDHSTTPASSKVPGNLLQVKFPGSQLVAQHTNDLTRVVLPLSANLASGKRSDYKKLKLTGEQFVNIYSVPETVSKSYLKTFASLRQQLLGQGVQVLWQCDSAEGNCGEYLAKQAVYEERGEDASDIYHKLTDLYNLDKNTDFAMLTGKSVHKNKEEYLFIIVNKYNSSKPVTYSIELIKPERT
jgi:hypothetical protein